MRMPFYCLKDNAIYYDIIFLAKYVKIVKEKSEGDGKYAAIAAIGHEMGHAADFILKWGPMPSIIGYSSDDDPRLLAYMRALEKRADCLAGAAVAEIVNNSSSASDVYGKEKEKSKALLEGRFMLYAVQGDTSNPIYPPGKKRMELFKMGFEGGVQGCRSISLSASEYVIERSTE